MVEFGVYVRIRLNLAIVIAYVNEATKVISMGIDRLSNSTIVATVSSVVTGVVAVSPMMAGRM